MGNIRLVGIKEITKMAWQCNISLKYVYNICLGEKSNIAGFGTSILLGRIWLMWGSNGGRRGSTMF